MIDSYAIFSMTHLLWKLAILGALLAASMLMAGCTAVSPKYQATVDNVRALQAVSAGTVSVGQFTAKDVGLNYLTIRGSAYTSPYNDSYAEYLKEALRSELESAGKLGSKADVVITGQLLKNTLSASIGTGTATIAVQFMVIRNSSIIFDKVLSVDTQWESSFIGAIAIPVAQQNYVDTVKQVLGKLFSDKDFQRSIQ